MNSSLVLVSISEYTDDSPRTHPAYRRENRIVVAYDFWHLGVFRDEKDLDGFLSLIEENLKEPISVNFYENLGEIKHYGLSKRYIDAPPYWNMDQLNQFADELRPVINGGPLKKVKGLSNGSIVDCYVMVGDEAFVIYRPNPNAKEVYKKMAFEDEMNFRRTNWYI